MTDRLSGLEASNSKLASNNRELQSRTASGIYDNSPPVSSHSFPIPCYLDYVSETVIPFVLFLSTVQRKDDEVSSLHSEIEKLEDSLCQSSEDQKPVRVSPQHEIYSTCTIAMLIIIL